MFHILRYDGKALVALTDKGQAKLDSEFEKDGVYRIERSEIVPQGRRGHYHATIKRAWENLPPHLAEEFLNPDALRTHALIKAGYCTTRKVLCDSPEAAAIAVAAISDSLDKYSVAEASGRVLTIYRADSTAASAMGDREYRDQKRKVLHIVSEMIGTDVATLMKAEAA